jgi:hypothetical protein
VPVVAVSPVPAVMEVLGQRIVVLDDPLASGLLEVLRGVPDPRDRRGRRYALWSLLAAAILATAAGMRSFAGIAVRTAPEQVLTELGLVSRRPSEKTFRTLFARLDAADLDRRLGRYFAALAECVAGHGDVLAVALDGKTVRGARLAGGRAPHLISAFAHHARLVIGQLAVAAKSNEVRREVPCRISHSVRRNSEENSWIRRLTRIPKGDGDQSMPEQARWPCPRAGAARRGDPRDMANAGLREVQSPVMQVFIHRKQACETGAALCGSLFRWLAQPLQRWAMPSEGIEGDEWNAYVTLERATRRKHGIAYGMRILWRRSAHSSQRGHVRSRGAGKPFTGRRGTGSSDITTAGGMRNAER